MRFFAIHTMQVESSITMVPAEPSMEPAFATPSKSIATSISPAVRTGRRGAAGDDRLSLRPFVIPCA